MGSLAEELRKKYRTPKEAMAALGLDEALLTSGRHPQTPKENCSMSKKVLSRFAGASAVAMGFYLKPKLAADAKIDLTPIFDGVSKKNFPEKQAKIAQDIKAAVKGKLAKDANLEDLTGMLDHLKGTEVEEGVDADPNSGLPMSAEEMKAKMGKTEDEDPKEKLRQFLSGKLSAEDLKACDDIMGMSGAEDEESEEAKKDAEGEEEDDHEVKDGKPEGVDKKAMDAAIKLAMDSTETRVRKQFAAAAEAREFVRPWAGSLSMALDSAETIYRAALDSLGVKHKGIHPDALRPILEAQPKPGSRKMAADTSMAEDSAPGAVSSGFASRWGEAADRIGHNA